MEVIYLAGGCFWGVEKYLSEISGVKETEVGYANGRTVKPSYEEVCYNNTGHAETVKVTYDEDEISLSEILELYYKIIDPVSHNRQGGDTGEQYRTGIYYTKREQLGIIEPSINRLQKQHKHKIAIEVKQLENYYKAEDYHQKYLDKNPNGYCHISNAEFDKAKKFSPEKKKYKRKSKEELREILKPQQFKVAFENDTEHPFTNEYNNEFREGIYVDITSGEPLFLSDDKYESGCGWPSFSRPVKDKAVVEKEDNSFGMKRTEVRTANSDIHLGHVFDDGPEESGGLRYCINSASLKFIPKEKLEAKGYGEWLKYFKPD